MKKRPSKLFKKDCDKERGGCGKSFRPTGKSQRLCEDCQDRIRRRSRTKKIINTKKN